MFSPERLPGDTAVAPAQARPASLGSFEAQTIAEAIPHIVWTACPSGATTYFNRRGTDYTGCSREENCGCDWMSFVHPDDAGLAVSAWMHATSTETVYEREFRIRRFDGAFRWHSIRAAPMRDANGAIVMWIGTATDIDDHRQLEISLRRSEREAHETLSLLRSIDAAAPVGFKLVDCDFRISRINETLAQVNGRSVEDHLGRTVSEIVPDLWPQLEDVYRRALAGETVRNFEISGTHAAFPDQPRYWLTSYYPVWIGDEIIGIGNVVLDITERREAEEVAARNLTAMVHTIATTVEYRDPYTAGHSRRVADMASAIGEELGLDAGTIDGIKTAASIHDIGKISVPSEILSKPGPLTPIEYELIKQHAEAGYNIVARIDFPWPVAEMIRQHHERLDGSGYPQGLRGDEILLGARIIAVADVLEAMTSHRPYQPGSGSVEEAVQQIELDRGRLLDDDVVEACLRALRAGRLGFRNSPLVTG